MPRRDSRQRARAIFSAAVVSFMASASGCALFPSLAGLEDGSPDAGGDSPTNDVGSNDVSMDVTATDTGKDVATDGSDAAPTAIANVQIGPLVMSTNTVTLTLPATSTNGNLLVATLACDSGTATLSTTSGFTLAVTTGAGNSCAAVFYRANNPGGVGSAAFSSSTGGAIMGQLTEWSGAAAMDATGSALAVSSSYTLAVSTSGTLAGSGELAMTAFGQGTGGAAAISYTAGTGWTNLGQTTTTQAHYTADYQLGVGPAKVSETETASLKTTWSGVMATFR